MQVKELINALERLNGDANINVVNTNYGSPMEYELVEKIITTKAGDALLVVSPNSQIGYYNEDKTDNVLYV